MDALRDAGRTVPDDVAIIGFDDRLEGAVQEPSLTTMRIPLFNMGYRAVELLYQHLEGHRRRQLEVDEGQHGRAGYLLQQPATRHRARQLRRAQDHALGAWRQG